MCEWARFKHLEYVVDGLNGGELIRVCLDADARVEAKGEEVVDHLEPEWSGWDVNPGNVSHGAKLRVVVVFEEAHYRHNSLRGDQDLQLISRGELGLLDILGQALRHILPKLGEIFPHFWVKLAHSWPCFKISLSSSISPLMPEMWPILSSFSQLNIELWNYNKPPEYNYSNTSSGGKGSQMLGPGSDS